METNSSYKIVYSSCLFPAYGYCDLKKQTIFISIFLTHDEFNFILEHEKFHLFDNSKFWIWREIKANIFAGICYPKGFLSILFNTLSNKDRLKYYWQRFKTDDFKK